MHWICVILGWLVRNLQECDDRPWCILVMECRLLQCRNWRVLHLVRWYLSHPVYPFRWGHLLLIVETDELGWQTRNSLIGWFVFWVRTWTRCFVFGRIIRLGRLWCLFCQVRPTWSQWCWFNLFSWLSLAMHWFASSLAGHHFYLLFDWVVD